MQSVSNETDACAPKVYSSVEIDASCRWPVTLLLFSATVWLVLGSLLALINSIKLHAPHLLASCPVFTYGRVEAAQLNCFLYGFASQAAIGIALWLLAHLGRTLLLRPVMVFFATLFWNLGVTIGVGGILAGDATGHGWFDLPRYASPILFVSFLLIAIVSFLTFHARSVRRTYPSQWFLIAAVLIFPWILSTAQILLVCHPVRGVMQAVVSYWYSNNFLVMWLGSVAIAAIYYFAPVISSRPLWNHYLALTAFWMMMIVGGWGGIPGGTPLPSWMPAVSGAASILMLVPVAANVTNWRLTLSGSPVKDNISLKFIGFATIAYLVAALLKAGSALRSIGLITDFTIFNEAVTQLALYGFIALTFFAAIYYIVPRLTVMEWACSTSPKINLWCGVIGLAVYVISLAIGGVVGGQMINDPSIPFANIVDSNSKFMRPSTLGLLLIFVANLALLTNFIGVLARRCRACCKCDEKGAKK